MYYGNPFKMKVIGLYGGWVGTRGNPSLKNSNVYLSNVKISYSHLKQEGNSLENKKGKLTFSVDHTK